MRGAERRTKSFKTIDLTYIALGAVLISICSWISIPAAIPFTMQTFAVFFVLSILGGKRGTITIIVYILLGVIGLPVFADFTSGLGVLLGSTGGYLAGFIFMGLTYWLMIGIFGKKYYIEIIAMIIGLAVLYAFGTAWFLIIYAQTNDAISITMVLAWCVIPFVIPDLIKLAAAITFAKRISAILKI